MTNSRILLPEYEADGFIHQPAAGLDPKTLDTAEKIIQAVEQRGEAAVREYAERFDGAEPDFPLLLPKSALQDAADSLLPSQREVLHRSADRIRTFAALQLNSLRSFEHRADGLLMGQEIAPLQRAGCYAPGGRYPLPSSVLMTAVTAKAAGVAEVVVASPRPNKITLAAAAIAGADSFLPVGGAQAIAAMALGLPSLPACDIIVGPGNRYVTAAKKLLQGRVGIDMLAGPSELVVVADESANPALIAADLLAQAEHDDDASTILLTTSRTLAAQVQAELGRQLLSLPTADVAAAALQNGALVLCRNLEHAAAVVDRIAPEHLSLQLSNNEVFRNMVHHYGALFSGESVAEVFGDYGAGPNHVLPTEKCARFSGGLSVHNFLRIRTWMRASDQPTSNQLIQDVVELARMEGLEAHARSALLRQG